MKTTRELSENAKELLRGETEKYKIGELFENCENIKIEIIPNSNRLKVSYYKYYYDGNGEKMDLKPILKTLHISDTPEIGEVEFDETTMSEVQGTYTKISEEELHVSNLKTELDTIILKAINAVEEKEGYDKL